MAFGRQRFGDFDKAIGLDLSNEVNKSHVISDQAISVDLACHYAVSVSR